jgi:outer membrane lipoprotein-sorting protein
MSPANKIHLLVFLLMAVGLSALAGCAKEGAGRPATESPALTQKAMALGDRIARLADVTSSIKAYVRFELVDGEESRKSDAAMVVARPNKIKVELMDSLADVWAEAGSDGKNVWLYLPSKKKLYSGRPVKRNLEKLVKFGIDAYDLVSLVSGVPPVGHDVDIMQVGRRGGDHFVAGDSGIHIWTDGSKGNVATCARYEDGDPEADYIAMFADYRKLGAVAFPYRIEITFPKRGAKAVVEYKDVKVVAGVDDSIFAPKKRNAFKTIDVGDGN